MTVNTPRKHCRVIFITVNPHSLHAEEERAVTFPASAMPLVKNNLK